MVAPRVSVLMPVYNGEKYIHKAIECVLNQTFADFELIILNDGSTDGTQTIIESFRDKRIRYVKHSNRGVANSLNVGLKIAKGGYIWRHDADDLSLPEKLEKQIKFLENHNEFVLVSTQIAFMTNNGRIAYDYKHPDDSYFKKEKFIKVNRNHFNPYSPITHATVLIRKEVFTQVGNYRHEFLTSEDTDLWLRIMEHYDVAVMHYCSYFVRINETSATKVYEITTDFYRNLAYQFADERRIRGTDSLQRGEPMPNPEVTHSFLSKNERKGLIFRNDLLDFNYRVQLNAKDYNNVFRTMHLAIIYGWRLSRTWKAILFPILGPKLLRIGGMLRKRFIY